MFRELQNAHSTIMDVAVVSFKTYLRIFSRKLETLIFYDNNLCEIERC
ncbi:hypothetical protein HMPREF9094_1911 [Fusobacterium animalis ATCC 51191]|uniref:Uncharacterized protein n=1 Tax=Fusobacterium animalis ATCC 51191 TaxID=997347 RepID=F9EPQ6_9FUSO|nr:hypothetical protein HMPREF9094_1911 [Fusobacterium animalis ATCC 51191]